MKTETQKKLVAWSDIPLRIALAATFIAHGWEKFSHGLGGFAAALGQMGVPAPEFMAWVVGVAELGGGILVLLGLLTRLGALAILGDMVVAILMVHGAQGFMMHAGESPMPLGFEWQFALAMMCLTLVLRGAGPFSLDHLICQRMSEESEREQAARIGRARATTATSTTPAQRADAKSIGVPPEESPEKRPPQQV